MSPLDLSLYVVLDPRLCRRMSVVETAVAAVAGGAGVIQLRDKTANTAQLVQTGRAIRSALAGSSARLIVNDDIEAALAIGADGLHVGQGDLPVRTARDALGPGKLLGLSVESPQQAAAIDPSLVDYAGVSPVFATATKPDHAPPVGLVGLGLIVAASPVPCVAIGGLTARDVAAVMAKGAAGIAVFSAVCGQFDPAAAARDIVDEIHRWRQGNTGAP